MSNLVEQRALLALQQGRIAEACQLFASIAPSLRARTSLFAAAVAFASASRFAEALGMLQRFDGGQQPEVESLNLRADICVQMGRNRDAAAIYSELLQRGQSDDALHYKLAQALFGAGAVEPAYEALEPALRAKAARTRTQAKLLKARCEAALGRLDQAQSQLEKLQKNGELKDVAQYRLARLALHRGDYPKAEKLLAAFLRKEPNSEAGQQAILLGHIYAGQRTKAQALIKQLPERANDVETLAIAGDYLHEMGLADVFEFWQRAWARRHDPAVYRAYMTRLLARADIDGVRALLDEYASAYRHDGLWEWGQMNCLRLTADHQSVLDLVSASKVPESHHESSCLAHFALGNYGDALSDAMALNNQFPGNQYFIAMLLTALRCLDDPRYQQLVNYDAMLYEIDLTALENDGGVAIDWAALATDVAALHTMQDSPMLQSVRSGTQSSGNLFTANRQGGIAQLATSIEQQARRVFAQVSELNQPQEHPLRMFRPRQPMMHASWSIKAAAATHHESHVHSKGWYSGTCYVDVPSQLSRTSADGQLIFGEPPFETKDQLSAQAQVLPEVGKLVLFPSYFWHGTRPFSGSERRLVVAFDFGAPDCFV